MKTKFTNIFRGRGIIFLIFMLSCSGIIAQNVPEYMYFKFDASGNQTNFASAPVGNNPATLTGLTIGGTGQFGTALQGNYVANNYLNTGWATSLPSTGWTISVWLNNISSNNSSPNYLFGDINANSFRCFSDGAALPNNLMLRGGGLTDVTVTGVAPNPTVVTFVYTGTSIRYFKNGVFVAAVAQPTVTITGTGPFTIGSYSTSAGMPAGGLMDEFRMYNRALTDAEVTLTWNNMLPLAGPPVCVTTAATLVAGTSATLNGTVNANAASTAVTFEYGTTTAYGNTVPGVPSPVTGNTATAVSAAITGLTPNTLYHFRVNGVNSYGTTNGNDMTFTTAPPPPTAVTTAATGIGLNNATLNGTINANGSSTTVTFQYGLTVAYGTTVPGVPSPVTGNTVTAVNAAIAGLAANTLYHYRVVGVSAGGTTNGNDMTFTTAGAPIVTTELPTGVGNTTATVNGTVNANNASSTVTFQYGLTVAYGSTVPGVPSPVTGNTVTPVSANLTGLTIYTTYHYRCVATNAVGTTNGNDMTFYTGCIAPAQPSSLTGPTSVCQGGCGYVYTCATVPGATSYAWTLPVGGTITSGNGTTSITVCYSLAAIPGFVTAAATGSCGTGPAASLGVVPYAPPVPTITGPATACQGSSNNVYTTQNGMSNYTWTLSAGGQIMAGAGTTQITVKWNGSGAQTVSVNYANLNGCLAPAATVYNVTVNATPAPTISGANGVCVNSGNYAYTTQTGMTGYVWVVSSGGTLNSGQGTSSISVSWIGSGAQTVSVNYNNASGCSASTPTVYPVSVNPVPNNTGTITGTASVCAPVTGINYSVASVTNATAYVWTLPTGATIGTGSGTNSITVNYGANAASGNINVYGTNLCGAGGPSPDFPVTVGLLPAAAGTISGPATACTPATGLVYSVPDIANASGYVWTTPLGVVITAGSNTNSITVDFPAGTTSGSFSVIGTNTCGNGTPSADYPVAVAPKPNAPVITENSGILTSDAATGNQWFKDNTAVPGATSQTYAPTATGHYTAVVTVDGCASDPSNDIYIVMTGIDGNGQTGSLSVYPNPSNGMFTLNIFTKELQVLDMTVTNSLGVAVLELKDIRVQGSVTKMIDLQNAPNGVYSILLSNSNTHILKKIVINK
jgi:hypothetical protein